MATASRSEAGQQDQVDDPAISTITAQMVTLTYNDNYYEEYEDYDEEYYDEEYYDEEYYNEEHNEEHINEEDEPEIIATQLHQHEISKKHRTPPPKPDPPQTDPTTECAICRTACDTTTTHMIHLPCHKTHIFHRACIREWATHSPTCPCCRAGIPAHLLARTDCAVCEREYDDWTEDVVFLLCDPSHAFHHECLFGGRRVGCRECPCCGCEVPVSYRALSLLVGEMRRVGVDDPRLVCVPVVEKIIAEADDQDGARRELYRYWLGQWF